MKDFREIEVSAEPERDPSIERKCDACCGDGVVPMIDAHGYQCGVARCPTCGGTRYEP